MEKTYIFCALGVVALFVLGWVYAAFLAAKEQKQQTAIRDEFAALIYEKEMKAHLGQKPDAAKDWFEE